MKILLNRHLALVAVIALFCDLLPAQTNPEAQQVHNVGRAKVELPTIGAWQELSARDGAMSFGGDSSGTVPAQYKAWVLLSPQKEVGAIVGVRASENFGVSGRMRWSGGCKAGAHAYVVDDTKGSVDGRDCLIVRGRVQGTQAFRQWMAGVGEQLKSQGVKLPDQLLNIEHGIMNDQGQFIETIVLTSVTFMGIDDVAPKGTLNSIRPRTARWADLMAQAARSSLYSLSGSYKFPNMTFAN
jgi:hypothetical protein